MGDKDLDNPEEFGKKLGAAYEDDYLVGRWYIGHASHEADRVYVIKGRNPDKADDWLADKHTREGHYGYEDGWIENVSLKECTRYHKLTLLPEHVKSLDAVEEYLDEAAERALALIGSNGVMDEADRKLSDSTDIVPTGENEINRILQVQRDMIKLKNEYDTMEISLNEKRCIMERQANKLKKKLEKMQNVLDTVGLYLGIEESLVQIQEGKEGEGPLCMRQLILYMDEELAVHHFKEHGKYDQGGADYNDIPMFDEWVKENIDKVLPESRGIVILKVRRHDKNYSRIIGEENGFLQYMLNIPNHKTYFLIRNGGNIYRIWENITITGRLFPRLGEIENTRDAFNERQQAIQRYNKHMLAIQGILDRTEVFGKKRYDLLNPDDDELKFIRDDEDLLPQGRKSWHEFKNELNDKIKVGTRFVLAATWDTWHGKYSYHDQFTWECDPPSNGLYNCTQVRDSKIYAMYFPGGSTYSWTKGYTDRTRRKSFYLHRGNYMLNYDDITLDDLDYYINDRIQRGDYIDLIPLLMTLYEQKTDEKLWESNFKEHLSNKYFPHDDDELLDYMLESAIDWWKFKVIEKRALKKEDAKAVRMIKGRVKRLLKGEVEPDAHIDYSEPEAEEEPEDIIITNQRKV